MSLTRQSSRRQKAKCRRPQAIWRRRLRGRLRYVVDVPEDARGELLDGRFSYREQKDGRVVISWYGRPVTTLTGKDAQKFMGCVVDLDDHPAQLLMARLTGNFKRGNERK